MKHLTTTLYIALTYSMLSLYTVQAQTHYPPYICKNQKNNLNISILLDLSDRIDRPSQQENDLHLLKDIAQLFSNHVQQKRILQLEDRISLFFEPDPSVTQTQEVIDKLKFTITRQATSTNIQAITKQYAHYPPKLYALAQQNPDTKKGAALWRFLKNKAQNHCVKKCHRNILIIFTDGYLYHKGDFLKVKNRTTYINRQLLNTPALFSYDWKKYVQEKNMGILWDRTQQLQDLEIIVIGIDQNEHKNPNAQEIITYYWEQWFAEMGITHYVIRPADAPAYLSEVITDFIRFNQ